MISKIQTQGSPVADLASPASAKTVSMSAAEEPEMRHIKLHGAAALVLSLVHILSVCGMAYQSPWKADHFGLINFSIWLSPALLPFVFIKSLVMLLICAVPILAIFCARMYFAWLLYSFGTNLVGQKGDAAWLATSYLGAFSVAVVALWLLFRMAFLVVDIVSHARNK